MLILSCNDDDEVIAVNPVKDINTAVKAGVDRFSATAGKLFVRTATNGLPAANASINFDNEPFITIGFDRTGAVSKYYNFGTVSNLETASALTSMRAGANVNCPVVKKNFEYKIKRLLN